MLPAARRSSGSSGKNERTATAAPTAAPTTATRRMLVSSSTSGTGTTRTEKTSTGNSWNCWRPRCCPGSSERNSRPFTRKRIPRSSHRTIRTTSLARPRASGSVGGPGARSRTRRTSFRRRRSVPAAATTRKPTKRTRTARVLPLGKPSGWPTKKQRSRTIGVRGPFCFVQTKTVPVLLVLVPVPAPAPMAKTQTKTPAKTKTNRPRCRKREPFAIARSSPTSCWSGSDGARARARAATTRVVPLALPREGETAKAATPREQLRRGGWEMASTDRKWFPYPASFAGPRSSWGCRRTTRTTTSRGQAEARGMLAGHRDGLLGGNAVIVSTMLVLQLVAENKKVSEASLGEHCHGDPTRDGNQEHWHAASRFASFVSNKKYTEIVR
mmetsp:Transcript_12210/g.25864  ORF Transcript_12210/g.25864 Transcript_12210/m.25864 type:complete len:384 (+) Transcript_12210:195-1346(+)